MSSNLLENEQISKKKKKDLRNLADFLDLIENIDIKLNGDRDSLRTPSPEQESLDLESDTSDSERSVNSDKINNNTVDEIDPKQYKSIKYVLSHIPRLRDQGIVDKFDSKYSGREYLRHLKNKKIIDNTHNFKSNKIDLTKPHIKQPKLLLKLLKIEEESYVVTGDYTCNNKTLLGPCERFPDSSAYVRMKKRWKREVAKWKIQRKIKKTKTKSNKRTSSSSRSSSPPGFSSRSSSPPGFSSRSSSPPGFSRRE